MHRQIHSTGLAKSTVSLLAVAIVMRASAQDAAPIATDRGTAYSSSPLIVSMGLWQIEAGYTYNRVGSVTSETIGELLLRYPVHPRFELRVSNVGFAKVPGNTGFVDPSIGFKLKLADSGPNRPDVGLIVAASVPAGEEAFRVDRTQVSAFVPWYQSLDATTGIGGQIGIADLGPNGGRFTQYSGGIYLARVFNPKTTGYLEVFGLAPLSDGGPNGGFVNLAFGHLLDPNTQLDFRLGTGFNGSRDGWFLGGGIAFRF